MKNEWPKSGEIVTYDSVQEGNLGKFVSIPKRRKYRNDYFAILVTCGDRWINGQTDGPEKVLKSPQLNSTVGGNKLCFSTGEFIAHIFQLKLPP